MKQRCPPTPSACRTRTLVQRHSRARWTAIAVIAGTAIISTAGPAFAGAPNYECRAGSQRLGIDQHRRSGLSRLGVGPVQPAVFTDSNQDGGSLDLTYSVAGQALSAQVRGYGWSVVLHIGEGTASGACTSLPGDFTLGTVTARRLVVRSTPAAYGAVVAIVGRRSLVWSYRRFDAATGRWPGTEDWTRVRVVLTIRGGAKSGEDQLPGMGAIAGLDGRSTFVDGWVRVSGIELLGPPGP